MDYSNSKIYLIKNKMNPNIIYIGSTVEKYLSKRFNKHKFQKTSINNFINDFENNTSWQDWFIELYELFPCKDRDELNKKEGDVIRLFMSDTNYTIINRCIAGRNRTDYIKDNNERIKQYSKEYYENNKAEINKKFNEYYEKNKENENKRSKAYRQANKDKLKQKAMEKLTCECGTQYTYQHFKRHQLSKKHQDFITSQNS